MPDTFTTLLSTMKTTEIFKTQFLSVNFAPGHAPKYL